MLTRQGTKRYIKIVLLEPLQRCKLRARVRAYIFIAFTSPQCNTKSLSLYWHSDHLIPHI